MRVGPLGCLALLGAASFGWAVGRLPDVIDGMARDLAAAAAGTQVELAAATPALPLPLPRHSGEGRNPATPQSRDAQLAVQPGSGRRRNDGGKATNHSPPPTPPLVPPPALATPDRAAAPLPGLDLPSIDASLVLGPRSSLATPAALGLAPPTPAARPNTGFALATAAYADLAAGNWRVAAAHFAAALAADPSAANALLWRRALRQLTRRWSSETYVIMRGDGSAPGLGTTPVLGGGQGGRSFSYTAAPLASHPLYAVIRTIGARTRGLRVDGESDSEQGALGLRWRAAPGATVSVERLFALTDGGRSAWTVRVAGGGTRRIGPLVADAYGEAGVIGAHRLDLVAGGQARLFRATTRGELRFETGAGVWAGAQRAGSLVDRVDVGPTLSLVADSWHVRATLDYRLRVAGNADPGSGPVFTVSRSF